MIADFFRKKLKNQSFIDESKLCNVQFCLPLFINEGMCEQRHKLLLILPVDELFPATSLNKNTKSRAKTSDP
jgi:hypothetical protein